jgi:hypothetical protein
LEPVAELSFGGADSENLFRQGDNLDALMALLPYYFGRVMCMANLRTSSPSLEVHVPAPRNSPAALIENS